ncbi:MAG: hypothetical protein GWM81_01370 [Desulfobacterales bacterium]|nr:hypothetical protein [Desulfobacterales bacterium]
MIIAGEASGDMHGANLVKAIHEREPSVSFSGMGGTALRKAGVLIRVNAHELSVVGLSEAFSKAGKIFKALSLLKEISGGSGRTFSYSSIFRTLTLCSPPPQKD